MGAGEIANIIAKQLIEDAISCFNGRGRGLHNRSHADPIPIFPPFSGIIQIGLKNLILHVTNFVFNFY